MIEMYDWFKWSNFIIYSSYLFIKNVMWNLFSKNIKFYQVLIWGSSNWISAVMRFLWFNPLLSCGSSKSRRNFMWLLFSNTRLEKWLSLSYWRSIFDVYKGPSPYTKTCVPFWQVHSRVTSKNIMIWVFLLQIIPLCLNHHVPTVLLCHKNIHLLWSIHLSLNYPSITIQFWHLPPPK